MEDDEVNAEDPGPRAPADHAQRAVGKTPGGSRALRLQHANNLILL